MTTRLSIFPLPGALPFQMSGLSYPCTCFQSAIASADTYLPPIAMRAMSSGVFTAKKMRKVSRFTPSRIRNP